MKKKSSLIIILALILTAGIIWYYTDSSEKQSLIDEDIKNEELKESLLKIQEEGRTHTDSAKFSDVEKKSISKRQKIIKRESEASSWAHYTSAEIKKNLNDTLAIIRTDCNRNSFNRLIDQCDSDITLGQFFERNEDYTLNFRKELAEVINQCDF